jgi:predicted anti-sigma-YlaC factor YlaD
MMNQRMMHGNCDRARHWVSADVDGELSMFERALLANHLAGCPACREFRASVDGLTRTLRTTPLEPFNVTVIARIRRRAHLRVAPAVAAMAIAAVGLGSILASSDVRTGSVARVKPASAAIDTMNLSISTARERGKLPVVKNARFPSAVRGGPVLHKQ